MHDPVDKDRMEFHPREDASEKITVDRIISLPKIYFNSTSEGGPFHRITSNELLSNMDIIHNTPSFYKSRLTGPTNLPNMGIILLEMIFVMVLYTTLQQDIGLKSPTFGLL